MGVTPSAAPRPANRAEPRIPTPLAVTIIVGAVILGLVVVGAVVWLSEPRLSTGPAVAPPPPVSNTSVVEYDGRSRVAQVQEMRVEFPEPPYECESMSAAKPPLFTSLRTCNAVIHQDYNKQGDDWYANFGIAVLSPSLVVPGDLQATSDRVYQQLLDVVFANQRTTIKKRMASPIDIAPTGKAITVSSEVHYSVAGLSSTYDRMFIVVVELADGEHAVCYSVRPSDTPKATLDVLNRSLITLRAK